MAYTAQQLEDLDAAIATGALRVKVGEVDTTFRSLADMLALRDRMARELAGTPRRRSVPAVVDRGL